LKLTITNALPAIYTSSGQALIEGITCGIRSEDGFKEVCGSWSIGSDSFGSFASCGSTVLRFSESEDKITLALHYVHEGDDVPFSDELAVLRGKLVATPVSVYGSPVRDCDGVKVNEMLTDVENVPIAERGETECGDYAVVSAEGYSLLCAFVTSNEFFSGIYVAPDGTFEARQYTEGRDINEGDVLESDLLMITKSKGLEKDLEFFCETVAKLSEVPVRKHFDVPSGYCTWYYYFGDIDENIVDRAITEIAAEKERMPVEYVQIDDGWQVCYGQWEENDKFEKGMKAHADRIKAEGYTPGLWFAPLWANIAKVRQEHPEYFAADRKTGEITKTIDLSVPEAADFVRETYRRVTYDWGYRYLKLDAITACFGTLRFRDPSFNSMKNLRECLRVIRESVPEDTFILGCTCPFAPVVGYVDGMRTSCDIGGDWDSTRQVFNRVLNRVFYHKRLFICDADCLIIRKPENEDSECRRECTRTDDEIKTFISATAASGGILMFSDKLSLLDDEQKKMLSYVFPQNKEAPRVLDLGECYIPGKLDCGTRGKTRTVMLTNWDDEPKAMGIDTECAHVFEFWSRTYKGIVRGRYETVIAPHCTEVLFLTEDTAPAVVGTDSRLIPTVDYKLDGDALTVSFTKKGESLYVAADSVTSEDCRIEKTADGLYKVTCDTASAVLKVK